MTPTRSQVVTFQITVILTVEFVAEGAMIKVLPANCIHAHFHSTVRSHVFYKLEAVRSIDGDLVTVTNRPIIFERMLHVPEPVPFD